MTLPAFLPALPDPLWYPVIVLFIVLIGAIAGLVIDSRNTRLRLRVEALGPAEDPRAEPDTPSIRLAQHGASASRRLVAAFLRMPTDLPAAHVVAPHLVALLGLLAGVLVALAAARFIGWNWAVPLGLAASLAAMRMIFAWELGAYRNALLTQLPDAIEMVVGAVRAGLPIAEAFRAVAHEMPAPTKGEFARVVAEMAVGTPADLALLHVHGRTRVTEFAIFAVTIGVQNRSGGRLVESVQKLAETVRYRLSMAMRARALAGEARVSAVILGSLPFAAGAALSAIRPGYLDPLFNDPRGTRLVVFAAIGMFLGIMTMRRMIRGATAE
jgi:tight adherence protein B